MSAGCILTIERECTLLVKQRRKRTANKVKKLKNISEKMRGENHPNYGKHRFKDKNDKIVLI